MVKVKTAVRLSSNAALLAIPVPDQRITVEYAVRPFTADQRGFIALRVQLSPLRSRETHDEPGQCCSFASHPVRLTGFSWQIRMGVKHPHDLAELVGAHIVFGVNHELVSSHTDVAAGDIGLTPFADDQQATGFAGKLPSSMGQCQRLVNFKHHRINPAAGNPPKGSSAFAPKRFWQDTRRLPQASCARELTVSSLALKYAVPV